jgi:hypothetical protein
VRSLRMHGRNEEALAVASELEVVLNHCVGARGRLHA